MPLSESDLKFREGLLEREKAEWVAGEAARKRSLSGDTAKQTALTSKVADLQAKVTVANAELTQAEAKKKTVIAETQRLEERQKTLDKKTEQKQVALNDLETLIETRRGRIDSEMEKYAAHRRAAADAEINKAKELLAPINASVDNATADLQRVRDELASERRAIGRIEAERQVAVSQIEATTEDLKAKIEPLEREIVELTSTKNALVGELNKLNYRKATIGAEIAKAQVNHENFLAYEQRARKELDTKDRSLREKAAELATEGNSLKARSSYLPRL